jgi:ketosteroid isomerase-like protein
VASVDNCAVVRAAWDAYNARDIDGVLAQVDPQVEWHEAEHLFDRGTYHGHEGVRRLIRENDELFAGLRADLDEVFDAGPDLVVALGHFVGAIGGIDVRIRFVHVYRLRAGRLFDTQEYEDAGSVSRAFAAISAAAEQSGG